MPSGRRPEGDHALSNALALLDAMTGRPAAEVAEAFVNAWRMLLTRSNVSAGCSLAAVTVATESATLRQRTGDAFRAWQARLAALLRDGGLSAAAADRHATLLLAATEGAVMLSRATGDLARRRPDALRGGDADLRVALRARHAAARSTEDGSEQAARHRAPG